jgi:hypothetical protein
MNKKILISVAFVLIILASISTFVDFSKNISGNSIIPATANVYFVLSILALVLVSYFLVRKEE